MKKITLHTAAVDNAGLRVDAGAELTVGDSDKPGHIEAKRAKELVDAHLAVTDAPTPAEPVPAPTKGSAAA